MTDLTDVLPIAIAFHPDFAVFRKLFDNCVEELQINAGDYGYRRSRREINQQRSRLMGFLLLDLKKYISNRMTKTYGNKDYPIYTGKCYKFMFITKDNDRFQNALQYNFKNKERYNNKKRNMNYQYNTDTNDLVRVRVIDRTMNYQLTKRYKYDATHIKKYDTSGKTSNKGLTAINYYTIENNEVVNSGNGYGRGGWEFGGLKVASLENFVVRNGFKVEKGKKYSYGDYAKWVFKTLN
jgi:hypothetical protein